jgi:hypothetical protein
MHIARKELRAFPSDSPEHALLRAVKTLRTRGNPPLARMVWAIERLDASRGDRPPTAVELSVLIKATVSEFPGGTIGELHDEVHRLIGERNGNTPYIRTLDMLNPSIIRTMNRSLRNALLDFFPHRDSLVFVASWYDEYGRREIAY